MIQLPQLFLSLFDPSVEITRGVFSCMNWNRGETVGFSMKFLSRTGFILVAENDTLSTNEGFEVLNFMYND